MFVVYYVKKTESYVASCKATFENFQSLRDWLSKVPFSYFSNMLIEQED